MCVCVSACASVIRSGVVVSISCCLKAAGIQISWHTSICRIEAWEALNDWTHDPGPGPLFYLWKYKNKANTLPCYLSGEDEITLVNLDGNILDLPESKAGNSTSETALFFSQMNKIVHGMLIIISPSYTNIFTILLYITSKQCTSERSAWCSRLMFNDYSQYSLVG